MERAFTYICIIQFLRSLAWQCISFLLALYAVSLGAPTTAVGLLFSVLGLARFIFENPSGLLVRRIGKKKTILIGSVLYIFSFVIFFITHQINFLFVAISLAGIGYVIATTGSTLYAADLAPSAKRATYMGIFQGSMMASSMVGPILGGLLADSYSMKTSFIASILFASTSFILATRIKESKIVENPTYEKKKTTLNEYAIILKNRLYLALFATSIITALEGMSFQQIAVPFYATQSLGLSIIQFSLIQSITSFTQILIRFFLIGRLEGRFNRRILIILGYLTRGVAIGCFALAPEFYSLAALSTVSGMGMGIYAPFIEAVWVDSTTDEDRGLVWGVRGSFMDFGQIVGPTLITLFLDLNVRYPFYLVASICILNGFSLFWILRNLLPVSNKLKSTTS